MNHTFSFTKMSGTGNDFILVDHRAPFLDPSDMPEVARRLCRRKVSAGADGLIFIERDANVHFSWRFFNADGSVAEMCGNGARCAARYAFVKGIAPAAMRFRTLAGIIEAEVQGEGVRLRLTDPSQIALNRKINIFGVEHTVHSLNTGVPHAVFFVPGVRSVPVFEWGREVRYHALFQPAGTNVNFVEVAGDGLVVRTYERGVEDETLACGTGATAAAIVASLLGKAASPVSVTTSGGEQLIIHCAVAASSAPSVSNVFLEGPASFIYEASLGVDALREVPPALLVENF